MEVASFPQPTAGIVRIIDGLPLMVSIYFRLYPVLYYYYRAYQAPFHQE